MMINNNDYFAKLCLMRHLHKSSLLVRVLICVIICFNGKILIVSRKAIF